MLAPATAHFARERLRRDTELVRALAHPGIVRPIEILDHGSWSLIAMERVAGRSLAATVAAEGPLHPDAVARLGAELAEALSAVHRCDVVHRDVKPENILLDEGGRARLSDFGCAHLESQALLTQPENPVTAVGCLPPEVIEGQLADPRSDVYALGMTLYFALVGYLPKGAEPHLPPGALAAGHHPREKRADVPEWLAEIVARATRGERGHRLETAERFARALVGRSLEAAPTIAVGPGAARLRAVGARPGPRSLSARGRGRRVANSILLVVRARRGPREPASSALS
jgi:serine/threonine protein kinase